MVAFTLLLLHYLIAFNGFLGYDDVEYINQALALQNGEFDLVNDHFSWRWTVIFSLVSSFSIFGFNEFSIAFPSLIVSALTITILTLFFKQWRWKIWSAALMLTCQWFLFYSYRSMSDIYIVLFFTMILYGIFCIRHQNIHRGVAFFVSGLFLAFITKGTVILFIPILFLLLILSNKTENYFYAIRSGIILLILFALYLVLSYTLTGNAFMRFNLIFSNQYYSSCDYAQLPFSFLWERISVGLWRDLFQRGVLLPFIFIVPVWIIQIIRKNKREQPTSWFWNNLALITILSCNFMTVSFSSYAPLCIDVRHYLFAMPIGVIAAIFSWQTLQKSSLKFSWIPSGILIASGLIFGVIYESYYNLYLVFGVATLTTMFAQHKLVNILLGIGFTIQPVIIIVSSSNNNYWETKEYLKNEIFTQNEHAFIVSDPVLRNTGRLVAKMEQKDFGFYSYAEYEDHFWDDYHTMFIINNYATAFLCGATENTRPAFSKYIPSHYQTISDKEGLEVYQVNDVADLNKASVVFESINTIDTVSDVYWKKKPWTPYQFENGKFYQWIGKQQFSEGIAIPMDSIIKDQRRYSAIGKVQVTAKDKVTFSLILAISDKSDPQNSIRWVEERFTYNLPHTTQTYQIERAFPDVSTENKTIVFYVLNHSEPHVAIDQISFTINELKYEFKY